MSDQKQPSQQKSRQGEKEATPSGLSEETRQASGLSSPLGGEGSSRGGGGGVFSSGGGIASASTHESSLRGGDLGGEGSTPTTTAAEEGALTNPTSSNIPAPGSTHPNSSLRIHQTHGTHSQDPSDPNPHRTEDPSTPPSPDDPSVPFVIQKSLTELKSWQKKYREMEQDFLDTVRALVIEEGLDPNQPLDQSFSESHRMEEANQGDGGGPDSNEANGNRVVDRTGGSNDVLASSSAATVIRPQRLKTTAVPSSNDDGTFGRFISEYQKVFRAISRSMKHASALFAEWEAVEQEYYDGLENEKRTALSSSATTTTTTTAATGLDLGSLETLKQQIRRAEDMLEASGRREEHAKTELRQLKQDVGNLLSTIKQGVGLSAVQERTIQELISAKEQAAKDLETEMERIVSLRNELQDVSDKIKQMDNLKRELDHDIFALKEKSAAKKTEIDTETRNKERLDRDLKELRVVVTIKSQEVQAKQDAVNRATEDISAIESQIKQQRHMIEKLLRDQESLGTRTIKLQQDYDEQMSQTSALMDENDVAMRELKVREDELNAHRQEVKKVTRIKELLIRKNRALEEQKVAAELERRVIRSENDALIAQLEQMKRTVDNLKKNVDDATREKDILYTSVTKTQTEAARIENLISLQKQQRYNIELDIAMYKKQASDLLKEKAHLEQERESYTEEAARLQSQYIASLQDLKQKELSIYEYKKQMVQADSKYKYQQSLYEAVQSDRNLHAKQLLESQSDIAEMKRQLRIMNFQINGYKEDMNSKMAVLTRETAEHVKLKKDIDLIHHEIETLKNQNELAQSYIKSQLAEKVKLSQFVKEAETERARQENAVQVLLAERDTLSGQLIRRNEELTLVYDKIKTQSQSLIRSENHYNERLKTIRRLHKRIHDIKTALYSLTLENAKLPQLKQIVIRLETDITEEKMRVKALEQELENPMNVHRWRKLEGSNPQMYEMIQLLHSLQKKLIEKAREEKDKEAAIRTKEELYLHLKAMLAKQVGPEAIEQIAEFTKQYKEKQLQLRHMDTELNMYQAQVREYKYAIEKLDKGIGEMRKKFVSAYRKRVQQAQGGVYISLKQQATPDPSSALPAGGETSVSQQQQPQQPQPLAQQTQSQQPTEKGGQMDPLPPLPDKNLVKSSHDGGDGPSHAMSPESSLTGTGDQEGEDGLSSSYQFTTAGSIHSHRMDDGGSVEPRSDQRVQVIYDDDDEDDEAPMATQDLSSSGARSESDPSHLNETP